MNFAAGPGGATTAIMALLLAHAGPLDAAGGNYSGGADLEPIAAPIDEGDYEAAIDRLHAEFDCDPDNADILSLPVFRRLEARRFENALAFYQRALRVEPKHRGANEYLGKLCLETGSLDKAICQLEILDAICTFGCKEYSQLKTAVDSYRESAIKS